MKLFFTLILLFVIPTPLLAQPAPSVDTLANQKIVFLGDSITQSGAYITFADYHLQKLHPDKKFDVYPLGLSSETLAGLSEPNHANGAFPRPCLFERLGRLLDKLKPDVIVACYGINDGIYLPLDDQRFAAFKAGVHNLIDQSKAAGVKEIFLLTPPIYDIITKGDEFNYDSVMTAYSDWEKTLDLPHVHVIDLHSAMRKARATRAHPFSRDHVHPDDGPPGSEAAARRTHSMDGPPCKPDRQPYRVSWPPRSHAGVRGSRFSGSASPRGGSARGVL